ncbi:MAG: response regulator transcription factor [Actinomycetia bacterium]|nr:response regulator transcription factor [Actinomycetes bacterium]
MSATSTETVSVLLATDSDALFAEVDAALAGPELVVKRVRQGVDVRGAVASERPDLVILDLQIGNMGAMAVSLDLRMEARADRLDEVAILMLLDREADVFLAKRAEADGWMVKPIDAFRLRRAAEAILTGAEWREGSGAEKPAFMND